MLLDPLKNAGSIREIILAGDGGNTPCSVFGVCESSRSHIASAIYGGGQMLFVTHQDIEAKKLAAQLEQLLPETLVLRLPPRDMDIGAEASSTEMTGKRAFVLKKMLSGEPMIVVAGAEALLWFVMSPDSFREMTLTLSQGSVIEPDELAKRLSYSGYSRVDLVEGMGQFSRRGGIVDVFPAGSDIPFRIEFFDNEIDSIRAFSPMDQRSTDMLDECVITPASAYEMTDDARERALDRARKELSALMKKSDGETLRSLNRLLERFEAGRETETLFALSDSPRATVSDYLVEGAQIVLDEPVRIEGRIDAAMEHFESRLTESAAEGMALASAGAIALDWQTLLSGFKKKNLVALHALERSDADLAPKSIVRMTTRNIIMTQGRVSLLAEQIEIWLKEGSDVYLFASDDDTAEAIRIELDDRAIPNGPETGSAHIVPEPIPVGAEYPDDKLVFVSLGETLASAKTNRARARFSKTPSSRISDFSDLAVGDVVVHDLHGLARYDGVIQMEVIGVKRDYLKLSFSGTDTLYVPTDQMHLVRKYIGSDDASPKLNKLGSANWNNTRQKVKASVREMAIDLAKLYAERKTKKGVAFSEDTPWQREFEGEFPYEETPDQVTCIDDIKRDMMSQSPMDRLLLGDVGYGKTEVAFRAAFKAINDSKQVALLVPTTLLAQQHYETALKRFAHFPVRVQVLSRFRTPEQQRAILRDLAEGKIDLLIGTHRLLAKDVVFSDLGLLIIDEEQRFGVAHKEKIRDMKKNVDVLTLSATPIPRTLHMSMTGIRDMSVIETPPPDRSPVQTYVTEYSDALIRDVILRELSRGGQTFMIYNKVRSIEAFAARIRALIPGLRVAVGHGQMAENALEDVMTAFVAGEYDVLVCTTIAENGLDIPNANTMIVYDSDNFGLSQLYQLRGRVGRSPRLAYAYFTYRRDRVMNETAEKRLRAIAEYTQFGSGFKIALRDLQIRGAGNLLGAEQHGHLAAVGYEMYCRLIEEAVREITGGKPEKTAPDTVMDLMLDAYIPDRYIANQNLKIQAYQTIAAIDSEDAMSDVTDELTDRYGDIPKEVEDLMRVALLKSRATACGVTRLIQRENTVELRLRPNAPISPDALLREINDPDSRLTMRSGAMPVLLFRFENDIFDETDELLQRLVPSDASLRA